MRKVPGWWLTIASLKKATVFCLLITAYFTFACSIPNLESTDCIQARETVKSLYSYHFGNDLQFTPDKLKQTEKFLTADLINRLQTAAPDKDPFTLTNDSPKAFRVGGCKVAEPGKKVNFELVFFWRTETRSEQREINVEAIKNNDKWLINKISDDNQK